MKKKAVIIYNFLFKDDIKSVIELLEKDVNEVSFKNAYDINSIYNEIIPYYETIYIYGTEETLRLFLLNSSYMAGQNKIVPILADNHTYYTRLLNYNSNFENYIRSFAETEPVKFNALQVNNCPFMSYFGIGDFFECFSNDFEEYLSYENKLILPKLITKSFTHLPEHKCSLYDDNSQKVNELTFTCLFVSPFDEKGNYNGNVNMYTSNASYLGKVLFDYELYKRGKNKAVTKLSDEQVSIEFKPRYFAIDNYLDYQKMGFNSMNYNFTIGKEIEVEVPKVRKK